MSKQNGELRTCDRCGFCNNQGQKIIPQEDIDFILEMLKNGNITTSFSSVYLENDNMFFDSSSNEYPHSSIKIYYCPMCGRKLNN